MNTKPRAPLLSSQLDWIVLEILILFVSTIAYTIIIWQNEVAIAQTTLDAFRTTIKEVVPFSYLAAIYIVGTFELGGEIMLRFTHKIERAVANGIEQGIAQGIEQGIEQGRAEVYRAWHADWERRRQDAEAKGIPFNEPPPPNHENGSRE